MFDNSTFTGPDATYYLPDEEPDADHEGWAEYCAEAAHVDRARVLECVLSSLDSDESPLYEFIDDAIREPHEPGRARDSITKLAALGQEILNLVAKCLDDQVNLRLAIGGAR